MNRVFENWDKIPGEYVAVLGAGISGKGASALLAQLGWDYKMYDEQERAFTYAEARACSIVICSPGFKKTHQWRKIAKDCGKKIITETDFASNFTQSKIIAVTGTNGKTTLATFLTHLYEISGKPAVVAGNVGIPLSQLVADGLDSESTIFLETSSFQSEDLVHLTPETVLWTNFDEDHLDYHESKSDYFHAKSRLLKLGEDGSLFIGETVNNFAKKVGFTLPTHCRVIKRTQAERLGLNPDLFLTTYPQVENIALAHAFSVNQGIDQDLFIKAVETYTPEPHRLQNIGTIGEATFWNDSKATNFASALAACKNFKGNLFWIGGGRSKGGMIEEFARKIKPLIHRAFLIGESGKVLSKIFTTDSFPCSWFESLDDAFKKAFSEVSQKTSILMSPGFASFDSFRDYAHRGNSFINLFLDLKKITTRSTHDRFA